MLENKTNQGQMLIAFVTKMIADKKMKLDAVQEEQLKARLYDKLNEQIEQSFVRALPNDKLVLLEKLLDSNASDEVIEKFFDESGIDTQAAAARAMEDFRQAFLKEGTGQAAAPAGAAMKPGPNQVQMSTAKTEGAEIKKGEA